MEAFFGRSALPPHLGATMSGNVQGDVFKAKARHYDSTLEAALDGRTSRPPVYKSARRRREPAPAGVPSLPEAAQADPGLSTSSTTTISTRRS